MSMTKTMNFFVTFKSLFQDHKDIVIPQYLDGDHNIGKPKCLFLI